MPVLAVNKLASVDYELLDKFEGGLKLTGAEVKAVRKGSVNLKSSFMTIQNGELFLKNAHIGKYAPAGKQEDYDPRHDRKVLVNKKQLKFLIGKHEADGLTIVPISVYTKANFIKLDFAIGRGKKKYEKRDAIKKRDLDREMRADMKNA